MAYANITETGWCLRAQWMVDKTKDAVDGLCKQHRDWLMPKSTMNGWYNKGCCGWFIQTTQRLVDAKGQNEWLIQQRMLWMVYANNTETGWCQRAQWMVDTTKDAVDGLYKQHRDWLMPKDRMNGWYNKGCCGWFMQTTQRLVDAKGHNEWLIQQRMLWMAYTNNTETGWCQRAQWMVDTTNDTGWFMQTTQRLVDAKGHNEWLIQKKMLWMVYTNNTETGWCQRAQWMVDTTKDAVDGLCKQHRDWLMPKDTMNG